MLQIGRQNSLTITEVTDHGLQLKSDDDQTLLLPNRYVTSSMKIGDTIEVFVYLDSEDRLVATTEKPFAQVGEFAYLEVVEVNSKVGAFLDWGLPKDLLLPYKEQGNVGYRAGDGAIVAIYLDNISQRIVASTKLHKFLPKEKPSYERNAPVDVLIYGESPLGYKAIVDRKYRALLYYEETSDRLEPGDQFTGYIKKVYSDGRIDLRRDPSGYTRVGPLAELILSKLQENNGSIPFNDKSSPEDIRASFDTSKKAFKQALGTLYKQRRIEFTESGIRETMELSNDSER